jgi:folate-binding protein YgfZ
MSETNIPAVDAPASAPTPIALPGRAVLSLEGPACIEFLQGIVSNDVTSVKSGQPVFAALLSPQGKILYDMMVVPDAQPPGASDAQKRVLLDVDAAGVENLARHLKRYQLRAAVTIAPCPSYQIIALRFGPTGQPSTATADGVWFTDPRQMALGARLIARSPDALARWLDQHEAESLTPHAYHRARIALGVPEGARDLPPERLTVLEASLDRHHGVSWEKGCYVGQEVTARMHYKGLAKRRMIPVVFTGPAPPPGTDVHASTTTGANKLIGTLFSAADNMALATIRLDAVPLSQFSAVTAGAAQIQDVPTTPVTSSKAS